MNQIIVKNRKITKQGNSYKIMLPAAFINHDILDKQQDYDVYFVPHGTKIKCDDNEKNKALMEILSPYISNIGNFAI